MREYTPQEPASRPGPITAAIVATALIGGLIIFYWSHIKDMLGF